jgi:Cu(I)-responsive transcriptional regulator
MNAPSYMNIGQAASAAGVTPKMIRHYESLGLIPEAERTDAGYRLYGERQLAQLRFIRQSRVLGFSIPQIASLLSLWRDESRTSREVKDVAMRQLQELEQRQRELDLMRETLSKLVTRCAGDHSAHCAILDDLASGRLPAPGSRTKRALKEVRAGDKVAPRSSRREQAPVRVDRPHAALTAWSMGLAASE